MSCVIESKIYEYTCESGKDKVIIRLRIAPNGDRLWSIRRPWLAGDYRSFPEQIDDLSDDLVKTWAQLALLAPKK